jgi:F0F1-type ATP synthase assembly protein I
MCYRKVVDNFIILLVLKFDSHRSDRLGVVLFTNSVTEFVQILYRFQKLHCLPNLMLQYVHGHYKKVVDAFLILLVLKFHKHRPDSLRVMDFTNCLLCSVHRQNRFRKLCCLI